MVNAQPAFRGRSKEALQPFTEFYFGFKKPATTPEAIAHNIKLAQKLLPNNFHCLLCDPAYGHYESKALKMAIAIVLFGNPGAMQFSIEEYQTGRFQARELNASDMLNKYVAHLRGLKAARRKAKGRFKRLAQEWFDFGFEYSGAMELEDPFDQTVTQASNVRPDTLTMEESSKHDYVPEAQRKEHVLELNEGGRYSKRAKGKGRA
ncbi:hypothetical protein RhiJN_09064 [Ceratobasidium sp. AG-Ba]|nr:hypothetical protein RhiJN_09064 [Ceratobasidium sp. AG-Ba]